MQTAVRLNALGLRSPRGEGWGKQAVQELTCRLGLRPKRTRRAYGGLDGHDGCWGLTPLAREIGMPASTLVHWITTGEVQAEQLASGRWVVPADAALIEHLRQRRAKPLDTVVWERWQKTVQEQP